MEGSELRFLHQAEQPILKNLFESIKTRMLLESLEGQNLLRLVSQGLTDEGIESGDLRRLHFSGGDVKKGQAEDLSFRAETHRVIVFARLQLDRVRSKSRRKQLPDGFLRGRRGLR